MGEGFEDGGEEGQGRGGGLGGVLQGDDAAEAIEDVAFVAGVEEFFDLLGGELA